MSATQEKPLRHGPAFLRRRLRVVDSKTHPTHRPPCSCRRRAPAEARLVMQPARYASASYEASSYSARHVDCEAFPQLRKAAFLLCAGFHGQASEQSRKRRNSCQIVPVSRSMHVLDTRGALWAPRGRTSMSCKLRGTPSRPNLRKNKFPFTCSCRPKRDTLVSPAPFGHWSSRGFEQHISMCGENQLFRVCVRGLPGPPQQTNNLVWGTFCAAGGCFA